MHPARRRPGRGRPRRRGRCPGRRPASDGRPAPRSTGRSPRPRAERGALAGRRLQQQERVVVVRQLVQQRQHLLPHLRQRHRTASRPPVAEPVCTTTPSAPISRPAAQRVPQRLHGPLDGRLGVRAEVDQVRARGRTPGSPRPRTAARNASSCARVAGRRRPAARIGDEDLDGLGAHLAGVRKADRGQAAGHGDMAADGVTCTGALLGALGGVTHPPRVPGAPHPPDGSRGAPPAGPTGRP